MHMTFPPLMSHPVLYPALLAYPFFAFGQNVREHSPPQMLQEEKLKPIKFHLIRSK